jgi:hypothetical protein
VGAEGLDRRDSGVRFGASGRAAIDELRRGEGSDGMSAEARWQGEVLGMALGLVGLMEVSGVMEEVSPGAERRGGTRSAVGGRGAP